MVSVSQFWYYGRVLGLIALLSAHPLFSAKIPCGWRLSAVVPTYQTPVKRRLDGSVYERRFAFLTRAGFNRARTLLDEERRAQLQSPEELMAYADALVRGRRTWEFLQEIENKKTAIYVRNLRFPEGALPFIVSKKLPSRSRRLNIQLGVFPPSLKLDRELIFHFPKMPPATNLEAARRVYQLAYLVTQHRLQMHHRGLQALGIPGTQRSFARRTVALLFELDRYLYELVHALEDRTGISPAELLPKQDGIWKRSRLQLTLETLWAFVFPFYNPTARYAPNQAHYDLFLKDVESATRHLKEAPEHLRLALEKKFGPRGHLKWGHSTYVTGIVLLALWHAGAQAEEIYSFFKEGDYKIIEERFDQVSSWLSPERSIEIQESYLEQPGGDPIVNAHYDAQISEIKKRIATEGDPDGELAQRLEDLKSRRANSH